MVGWLQKATLKHTTFAERSTFLLFLFFSIASEDLKHTKTQITSPGKCRKIVNQHHGNCRESAAADRKLFCFLSHLRIGWMFIFSVPSVSCMDEKKNSSAINSLTVKLYQGTRNLNLYSQTNLHSSFSGIWSSNSSLNGWNTISTFSPFTLSRVGGSHCVKLWIKNHLILFIWLAEIIEHECMGKLREDIPLEHYPCQWSELEYPFKKKKEKEKFIQQLESIFKHEIVRRKFK